MKTMNHTMSQESYTEAAFLCGNITNTRRHNCSMNLISNLKGTLCKLIQVFPGLVVLTSRACSCGQFDIVHSYITPPTCPSDTFKDNLVRHHCIEIHTSSVPFIVQGTSLTEDRGT